MRKTVGVVRERERKALKNSALFYDAKNKKEYITNKDKYAWIKHRNYLKKIESRLRDA